jgi:Na+/phosphate symporter
MADFGSVTFTELHLFPRTLFAIGAALFIFSLVPPTKFPVALLGLGLIFFAVAFNILYDLIRSWKRVFEKKDNESDAAAAARRSNENVQLVVL